LRGAELKQVRKIKIVSHLHIRLCSEGESYMKPFKKL
jgi:hypothetical protein